MTASLLKDIADARDRVAALDPALYRAEDCAAIVSALATVAKVFDAARARFAARAAAAGAHRAKGFVDAGDWLASETGTSTVEARRELDTATAVDECPLTAEALAAGELSLAQAREIAKTEAACPGSESELLDTARRRPLRVLRDESRKRRLAAVAADELAREQHRRRRFRHWRDEMGMVCGSFALPPIDGVAVLSRIEAEAQRVRRGTETGGEREPYEAHAADALVNVVTNGGGAPSPRKTDVVFVCDLNAYRRGNAQGREVCHVIGGGKVPVRAVREAIEGDAFVKAVIHDGVKIDTVAHLGRYLKAELRTALDIGRAPTFDGRQCGCGCGKVHALQNDHIDPAANGGVTSYENLQPRTHAEHAEKTRRDREAGLLRRRRPPPAAGGP